MYRNEDVGIIPVQTRENKHAMNIKSIFTSAALLVCISAFCTPPQTSVFFETNMSSIDSEYRAELLLFAEQIDATANFSIVVKGHADYRGDDEFNQKLAMERANAVREFFVENGFHPFELRVTSEGENQSAQSGQEDEIQSDRRVDIEYIEVELNSTEDLHKVIGFGNDIEKGIDPAVENVIRTARGSSLRIPANSLVDENGNPYTGRVQIELTEALDPMEFLSENLATWSGDEIIVTDGMMKVGAVGENGENIQVSEDAELQVFVPSASVNPDIQLFTSTDGQDWQATGQRNRQMFPFYPPRPQMRFVSTAVFGENFQGLPSSPIKPCVPVEPTAPSKPRWSDYAPEYVWYDFLWRAAKTSKAKERFAHAMGVYEWKHEKYAQRLDRYQNQVDNQEARQMEYLDDCRSWDAEYARALQEYCDRSYWPLVEAQQKQIDLSRESYDRKMAAWNEVCAIITADYEAEYGPVPERRVSGYQFGINAFGWINCDYFYNNPNPQHIVYLEMDDANDDYTTCVALSKAQALLRPNRTKKGNQQLRLPIDEPGTIISYKIEDKKIMLCVQELKHDSRNELEFKEVTMREMRMAIGDVTGA